MSISAPTGSRSGRHSVTVVATQTTQPFTSSGEPELLARLRAGDDDAYELLVRQFGGRLLAVARRYLHSEEDAADAVQDAFLSAFRAIDSFAGQSAIGTWLHRIVVNACLMKLRARPRHDTVSIDGLLPAFDESGHHVGPAERRPEQPESALDREETRALVRACIDRLPDEYRTILLLRDIDEVDTEQTAKMLGISRGAVKTRLHRARQALRTLLTPVINGQDVA